MNAELAIISTVLLIIFIALIYQSGIVKKYLERFSVDEAIQNVASLYNEQQMTVSNLNVTQSFNLLPRGLIVAWPGTTVPAGWALCDGTNGTPDLRERFIFGASPQYQLGDIGGEVAHTLTVNEIPSHNHGLLWNPGDQTFNNGNGTGWWGPKRDGILYTENTGGGQPHNNMPPYKVLYFIMKL